VPAIYVRKNLMGSGGHETYDSYEFNSKLESNGVVNIVICLIYIYG
jgi:hypothetical protein